MAFQAQPKVVAADVGLQSFQRGSESLEGHSLAWTPPFSCCWVSPSWFGGRSTENRKVSGVLLPAAEGESSCGMWPPAWPPERAIPPTPAGGLCANALLQESSDGMGAGLLPRTFDAIRASQIASGFEGFQLSTSICSMRFQAWKSSQIGRDLELLERHARLEYHRICATTRDGRSHVTQAELAAMAQDHLHKAHPRLERPKVQGASLIASESGTNARSSFS